MPKNMEFTKTSNVGPLIAAVLVGLLSLCIPFVVRMSPDDIDGVLRGLKNTAREAVTETDPAPRRVIRQSPDELLADIKKIYRQLLQLNKRVRQGAKYNPTKVQSFINYVGLATTDLEDHQSATGGQKNAGALDYFKCLFIAAELEPRAYSTLCQSSGEKLLQTDSPESRSVRLFLGYHTYGFSRIQNPLVLKGRLVEFSRAHSDEGFVIDLHLLVARELQNSGKERLATQVLKQALAAYAHSPARTRLSNALIDLKMQVQLRQIR